MIRMRRTSIAGCMELFPLIFEDARGRFIKTFQAEQLQDLGLRTDFVESYYSTSHKNVIRGLHFQAPPNAYAKIVYCSSGAAFDVVVDVRLGSPTYGKYEIFELNQPTANMIYMSPGLAHGFLSLSDSTTLIYSTTAAHAPGSDLGIRWNSTGIPWPIDNPILSQRDARLAKLESFVSPFVWDGKSHTII
jgi:dTDP-4-dehydrorhamnose 3,5-epimerase